MCGIYAVFNEKTTIDANEVRYLAKTAQARGVDSAGIVFQTNNDLQIIKRDFGSLELIGKTKNFSNSKFIAGHSRLVTNDVKNNQPVVKEELIVIHNGIITNYLEIWESIGLKPETELDSELIPVLFDHFTKKGLSDDDVVNEIFNICEGVISAILIAPRSNKVHLISNNGSLYYGYKEDSFYVASESYPLTSMSLDGVTQVFGLFSYDYNFNFAEILVADVITKKRNYLLPKFEFMSSRDKLLERPEHDLKRCKKCILPETMPYITFDEYGVCNYCNNYTLKNIPKPVRFLNH